MSARSTFVWLALLTSIGLPSHPQTGRQTSDQERREASGGEEAARVRALLERYLAHRRSLNHFRCRYRVYSVRLSIQEVEAFEADSRLPPEDRWELRAECLWICQPEAALAVTRLMASGEGQTPLVAEDEKRGGGRGEGRPGAWLLQAIAGGGYVATAMGTGTATIYQQNAPGLGPVVGLLGPTPHSPPTSMALMGMGEESNAIVKYMLPNLARHPDWFALLGPHRSLSDHSTRGVRYAPMPSDAAERGAASNGHPVDSYWFATDAGYLPVYEDYTYSTGRAVGRMLDVRQVAEGRWFPILSASVSTSASAQQPRAHMRIIRVDEFEWGYDAAEEEIAIQLAANAIVRYRNDTAHYDLGRLTAKELPSLVEAISSGLEQAGRAGAVGQVAKQGGSLWPILLAGVMLLVLLALWTRYASRRVSS